MIHIEKWSPEKPISAIYWDGDKENYYVKRFLLEVSDKEVGFISEHEKSHLEIVLTDWKPIVNISFDKRTNDRVDEEVNIEEFISVKGLKALGNRLTTYKVKSIEALDSIPYEPPVVVPEQPKVEIKEEKTEEPQEKDKPNVDDNPNPAGFEEDGQATLF
jgi:topoisomerase-4 subunit A